MHRNMTRLGLVLLLIGAAALAITGCKEEGSAEKAGKELDKAAEDAGHRVVAVLCLVDREEGGAAKLAAWPYYPLFRRHEIFDESSESRGEHGTTANRTEER